MAESNYKSSLKEWQKIINKMSISELQDIITYPNSYYPDYLKLAKEKIEALSSIPEHVIMKGMLRKCLKELGCPFTETEDGDLDFYFQGDHFLIMLGEDNHYIDICDYCWMKIDLGDTEKVERLKHSINYANANGSVTTVYFTDDDEQYIGVYCTTSILYRPMITELKDYLAIRLNNFFLAHDLVNSEMTLMAERDRKKQSELDMIKIDKSPVN